LLLLFVICHAVLVTASPFLYRGDTASKCSMTTLLIFNY